MRPIKGTVTDPVALRRALGGEKMVPSDGVAAAYYGDKPGQENPLAEALRKAQKGKDRAIRLFQQTRDDLNRLGEDLRSERLLRLTAEQDLREAIGMVKSLREDVTDLRRQMKAFEAAGSAVERAVLTTFEKLRAEIETKDALIRALIAEGD